MFQRTRSAVARLVLALALIVPLGAVVAPIATVATATPAAANHGDSGTYCYDVDTYQYSTYDWYGDWVLVRDYYQRYWECTDGHWWWWEPKYAWYDQYWQRGY